MAARLKTGTSRPKRNTSLSDLFRGGCIN